MGEGRDAYSKGGGGYFKFWPIGGTLIRRRHLFERGTNLRIYRKSSLQNLDKQQISFLYIIHFCVKYSDWLVATAVLKFTNFGFKSVRLSWQLCKILLQLGTF